MRLLQCPRWQVVQSAGDVSDSAFNHSAPPRHLLLLILCLMLFQWTVQQAQKQENAKRFRPGYLCLISLCSRTRCCIDQQAGDVIVAINKAEPQPRTTSDGDSLLLPPFHRFGFLILPSFPPLIHYPAALIVTFFSPSFHFQNSDVSSRFSWTAKLKGEIEGTWLTFFLF